MATHTVCGVQRVVVAHVAGGAGRWSWGSVRACQREACHAVVERSGVPTFRRMAIRAVRGRKTRARRRVYGSCRLLPFRQMAPGVSAVRRRDRQIVVVVGVARGAGHIRVAIRQQESRGGVIEIRRVPTLGGMATRAVCHDKSRPRCRMHRVTCFLPGR